MKTGRIVLVQYTNPAGYPPLINAATLLADAGWRVLVLGAGALGTHALRFPADPRIEVRYFGVVRGGWRQKVHYALFVLWSAWRALRWRAGWWYVSDPLATPIGLLASRLPGAHVVYHEHDTPAPRASGFFRGILAARRRLAQRAELCVLPNAERVSAFRRDTGRTGPTLCVWNCPRLAEVPPAAPKGGASLTLYYHGSLNAQLLPATLLEALTQLPDHVRLCVVGYETVGSAGFTEEWRARAAALGVAGRVEVRGAVDRAQALRLAAAADVGLVLVPPSGGDFNLENLVGASNKAFDYLAGGLMLLVTQRPDWQAACVAPGLARACDPRDAASVAREIRWCLDHRGELDAAGERGRRKVLDEWNYEKQFAPVLAHLAGP